MPSARLWLWLPLIFAASNYIAVSGFHHPPASSRPHPSASSIKNSKESNDTHDIMGSTATAEGGTAADATSRDAEAYNDIVSAAVDFTSIYLRKGVVTGEDRDLFFVFPCFR